LLKYYLTDGKDDSDDCTDAPCPASGYWNACLVFFFYYPFGIAVAIDYAADSPF
jgi:hypothetical protein